MASQSKGIETNTSQPDADPVWHVERDTEVLRSVAETEGRTIYSNFVGTLIIGGVSQLLPNAADFHLPILLRLVATLIMTSVFVSIRKKFAAGKRPEMSAAIGATVGVLGGATWALLLAPVFFEPSLHPAAFIVAASVLICTSLVAAHNSPLPWVWYPFGIAFLSTFWVAMLRAPSPFGIWMSLGVGLIYLAVASFSLAAARQRYAAAETLINNHRLGEDLAEALARAEFLANRDPLTGLYNRRALFESELTSVSAGERNHVLLLDLDNFKQVNDRHGHDIGDRVLIAVGHALQQTMRNLGRKTHFAARLGGEEFAVFLALDDSDRAREIAETIRTDIEAVAAEFGLSSPLGTASIGVAEHRAGEAIGAAIKRADKALYEAKAGGRNRIVAQTALTVSGQ